MNITIWDLDWYSKMSFIPNIKCMKISSYHKQKGDKVLFINNEHQLSIAYDTIYIIKESKISKLPSRKILDDKRTILIGKGFEAFKTKEISAVMAACRPDYLLYETDEKDKYGNANFISFYVNGKLIKNQQDYHNTAHYKHFTIVADKWFWNGTDEEIIWCLQYLKNDKNLMFLEPISLKRILCNNSIRENFLNLHFSSGTPFKWRNDFSSENIKPIIDFLLQMREKTKSNLGFIPIRAMIGLGENELELLRCFQIIDKFKQNKLKCIVMNNSKDNSYLWDLIESWTRYGIELSFVEYVLHFYCLQSGVKWNNILNNSIHWRNAKIDYLLYLLTSKTWENYRPLLLHQWGSNELNGHEINYDYIQKNINLLYKDFNNE